MTQAPPADSLSAMKKVLGELALGKTLSEAESERAFDIIMSGDATPAQIGAFLMALRLRGETVEEITGAVRTMRAKALSINAPANAIDVVGTGGDSSGSFNISTTTAFVVAASGVPVAKHGNRALSSKSGAADVLTALGVKIDCEMPLVEESLWQAHIGFLMAPRHHSAMRHVAGPRVELGTRTIFNLLGPLSNPAGAKRQLTGVFAPQWVEPLALVLGRLGSEKAWVMHGDGMDELTTTGPSQVAELKEGKVSCFEVTPEMAGLQRATKSDLLGGDPAYNAVALMSLLDGVSGPYRDIVILNAAAALIVADKARDLKEGAALAAQAIDTGAAKATLQKLVQITNRPLS
ncbi:MAG: anthranilate phosphoribosyltransferase [Alphaproteobacteria bacterium]|nr:anthranilate phosphoribosyltransferase [Alphaproteobacteria bacterium]